MNLLEVLANHIKMFLFLGQTQNAKWPKDGGILSAHLKLVRRADVTENELEPLTKLYDQVVLGKAVCDGAGDKDIDTDNKQI